MHDNISYVDVSFVVVRIVQALHCGALHHTSCISSLCSSEPPFLSGGRIAGVCASLCVFLLVIVMQAVVQSVFDKYVTATSPFAHCHPFLIFLFRPAALAPTVSISDILPYAIACVSLFRWSGL